MRKNGVNRTFEPVAEGEICVDGFVPCSNFFQGASRSGNAFSAAERREEAALSLLGLSDVLFCRSPAAAAFITGGNAFFPCLHEASKTAALKDRAKAAIFFDGRESPFSSREKAACEKLLKDIFFSLRIGRNEIISFTCDGAASQKVARSYTFRIGDYSCRLCCVMRCAAKEGSAVKYRQFLLLTDAKISAPMLQRMLKSLSSDPLHFADETAGGRAFDAAAFLSSARAENYLISAPDGEYAKTMRLIRSIFYDFLLYAAKQTGERLVKIRVSGAKSAQEASGVALAFVRRRAVYEEIKKRRLSPLFVLECVGAAGERNRAGVTAELSSSAGKVCLVFEGTLLSPPEETTEAILSADDAELSVELLSGNYSYSACMYVPCESAEEDGAKLRRGDIAREECEAVSREKEKTPDNAGTTITQKQT
ncbi:MAG: hypothetical protein SPH68_01425 [Candidatus Borkfalkiaceae bacterium]|nr:hypothetical protein [Clostridia bacterium]MDY6222805.1 hypothetical protein [Christensenellaceae bacterium]